MLIRNAVLPDGREGDVRIDGSRIDAVGADLPVEQREPTIDATGLRLLPGAIDTHVHFREPGFAHKETWPSGSASAAAGGVTTVVDQPNTDPPTVDGASFDQKVALAGQSHVDYGINGGVTSDWAPAELFDRPIFALGEVFLADSTGEMGIDRELFETAVNRAREAAVVVTVHAEDADRFDTSACEREDAAAWSDFRPPAAELAAIETVAEIAGSDGVDIHIAHASTPEGVDAAVDAGLTCEVTPHHLLLSRDDLATLGTEGRMNPPLRDPDRCEGVWQRLVDGTIDIVASDHAPHTSDEKGTSIWEAPSGVPGVETALPLLAAAAEAGMLDYDRIAEATARRPAEIFELPTKGRIEPDRDADLVLLDPEPRRIRAADLHTACDWTPFEGWEGVFPTLTLVRGRIAFEDGRVGPALGRNVRELETD